MRTLSLSPRLGRRRRHSVASVCGVAACLAMAPGTLSANPEYRFDSSFIAFEAGGYVRGVAVADFDADGHLDVAAVGYGPRSLTVFLGSGGRWYRSRHDFDIGTVAMSLAVGDFDEDGTPDLAVTLDPYPSDPYPNGRIAVLLGNGDGTFAATASFEAEVYGNLVAADLDGDDHLDLAAGGGTTAVQIWRGDGEGGFGAMRALATGFGDTRRSVFVACADVDSDGDTDLAVVDRYNSRVYVMQGNGRGDYGLTRIISPQELPHALALADLNGDSRSDIVVANETNVSVFLRHGDSFDAGRIIDTRGTPRNTRGVRVANIDGDAHLDLVVAWEDGTISIYPGTGAGSFAKPIDSVGGGSPTDLVVADLDADSRQDVVLAAGTVAILPGNGDATFGSEGKVQVGGPVLAVQAADWNRDGIADLAASYQDNTSLTENRLAVHLGDGRGGFALATDIAVAKFAQFVTADLNRDDAWDIVTAGTTLTVLLGNGDGTFAPGPTYAAPDGETIPRLGLGDFDGDGVQDLVLGGRDLLVGLGAGDGTFRPTMVVGAPLGPSLTGLEVLDLDGDAVLDIVASYGGSYYLGADRGGIVFLRGLGDGGFAPPVNHRPGSGRSVGKFAIGSLNRDAHKDIVATLHVSLDHSTTYSRTVLLGTENAAFTEASLPGGYAASLHLHDLDGDGLDDLGEALRFGNDISWARGLGDGSFAPQERFGAGKLPAAMLVVDVDGDHREDLVVANARSSYVSLLRNRSGGPTPVIVEDFRAESRADGILLAWSHPATGLPDILQLSVGRSARPDGPFDAVHASFTDLASSMSFLDTQVEPGRMYWYVLQLQLANGRTHWVGPIAASRGDRTYTTLRIPYEAPAGFPVHIRYELSTAQQSVRIEVLDVRGRLLRVLPLGAQGPGAYSIPWNRLDTTGRRVPRGLYLLRLTTPAGAWLQKAMLLR